MNTLTIERLNEILSEIYVPRKDNDLIFVDSINGLIPETPNELRAAVKNTEGFKKFLEKHAEY